VGISGPALGALGSFDKVNTQNTGVLSYALDHGWTLVGAFNWQYTPSTTETLLLDPWVTIQNFGLYKSGSYSAGAFFRFIAPVSLRSVESQLVGRTRVGVAQQYQWPNSSWSAGLFTFMQNYLYASGAPAGGVHTLFFAEPSISYQINPTLSASLLYDMDARNFTGASFLNFGGATTALMPALSWSATPWLTVEPSLYLTTGGRISLDTTTTNLQLTARL
jgi:hypothetical protein